MVIAVTDSNLRLDEKEDMGRSEACPYSVVEAAAGDNVAVLHPDSCPNCCKSD